MNEAAAQTLEAATELLYDPLFQELFGRGLDIATAVVLSLVILVGGWVISRWTARGVRVALGKIHKIDPILTPFLANLVRYGVMIVTLVLVLSQFGVQTASIIAVLGAMGLAIGLALQGTLQNIAAGIMLLLLRPFKQDDYIDAGGNAGTVREISLFTTTLETVDGLYLSVPNNALWGSAIHNYSRNPARRTDINIDIAYEDDMQAAIDALMQMAEQDERILAEPAPETMLTMLGESGVTITLRIWTANRNVIATRYDLLLNARRAVEAAGCTIPYPQRVLHIPAGSKPPLTGAGD